jgi:hypothetical protein
VDRGEGACSRSAAKQSPSKQLDLSDIPRLPGLGCCAAQREQAPSPQVGGRLDGCGGFGNRGQARSHRFGVLPSICGVLKTVSATRPASRY